MQSQKEKNMSCILLRFNAEGSLHTV